MNDAEAGRIAEQYAPIFAQKIDDEWPAADRIAPIEFAGGLTEVADNIPELFSLDPDAPIDNPKIYYALAATSTHVFVTYAAYHVFDWWKRLPADTLYDLIRDRLDEHAHDLEGALVVLRRYPRLAIDGLVTVSHNNFYLYTRPMRPLDIGEATAVRGSLKVVKFNENVDGHIWLDKETDRIKLFVESKGHGVRGDHSGWGGGQTVCYYKPPEATGDPAALNEEDRTDTCTYQLEDVFAADGLWRHRFRDRVFRQRNNGRWGLTCYSKLTHGNRVASAANPPWSWNNHNDPSPMGEIATDPAHFIIRYAQGWGPVSTEYVRNPFVGIRP